MGDLNLDLTENARFLAIPYSCAAIGAVTAFFATIPAAIIPAAIAGTGWATAATCIAGAVVGGIGLPIAVAGIGLGAFALLDVITRSSDSGMNVSQVLPATALAGIFSAKALFVTPFQVASSVVKSAFSKKKTQSPQTASSSVQLKSTLKDKTSKQKFNESSVEPSVKPVPTPKNQPKPPTPS